VSGGLSEQALSVLLGEGVLTRWREELRVKESWELVVTVAYESPTGKFKSRRPSKAGLVDPDGNPVPGEVVNMDLFHMRLGLPTKEQLLSILGREWHELNEHEQEWVRSQVSTRELFLRLGMTV
jgi:hypothetical protein